ncbi:MAG: hypothetical protein EOM34_09110 [Clostridia bacterium]|nr:hypothetical protein [Lachnospiraceae bacterium]NCC00824.1 hypothetical protein [Clostridia bacterium]NCD02054.1 hypothetical protein [Clostridia bacterium]
MVPRVNVPQGVSTPDYLINGKKFDLKSISGDNKNTLYNAVSKKNKQSSNFIFDISQSKLSTSEIFEQIERLYASKHTSWIDEIIVVKDGKVLRVTERNK